MREFDLEGSKLCSYQAAIFSESLSRYKCSSKIFLRRFFKSDYAHDYLDEPENHIFDYDTITAFEILDEEYDKDSSYGKNKIDENVMHWVGYITRYICYTRGIYSRYLYRLFGLDIFIDNYYVYHTQSEEWVISRILEVTKLTEDDINPKVIDRRILRRLWKDVL